MGATTRKSYQHIRKENGTTLWKLKLKPYVKIEIKLTYVDPNKWFGKEKFMGNNTIITTLTQVPIISENLARITHEHGIRINDEQKEPKALTEKKDE